MFSEKPNLPDKDQKEQIRRANNSTAHGALLKIGGVSPLPPSFPMDSSHCHIADKFACSIAETGTPLEIFRMRS